MADAARCCSGPLRSPNQCLLLAKAPCFTRPPLLLGGSKVPCSANQVATRWARILLGFPCFGCVLTGDAGGCDVPLEWLMPHGFAQGRYVRPTNACRLLAKASCFTRPPLLLKVLNSSGSANLEQSVGFESCWGFSVLDGRLTCL